MGIAFLTLVAAAFVFGVVQACRGRDDSAAIAVCGSLVGFVVACGAAWVTHVVVCLSAGLWGFLIAGALVFPIAIIHGFGIWFGAF